MVTRHTKPDKSGPKDTPALAPADESARRDEPSAAHAATQDAATSDPQNVREHDGAPAPQPIPGASLIGRGIYLKTRQPYEIKACLFDLGRGQAQTFTSLETGETYSVPDNCVVNNSPPAPAEQSLGETIVEESWDRFGTEMTVSANAAVTNSLISIDPTAFRATALRAEEDSYYALRSSFIAFWNLSMVDVPRVPDLDRDVEDLPLDPLDPSNRPAYARIFAKYGSHYVKSVWVGGKASLVFLVAKSSRLTKDEVRAGIQAAIGGIFTGGASRAQSDLGDRFRSNSTCKVFGSGGDRIELAKLSTLDQEAYKDWVKSVKHNPQVIQFGLAGIWTLVTNHEKAECLKTAYVQESTFRPLTSIIPLDTSMFFFKDDDVFEYRLRERPGAKRTSRNPQFIIDMKQMLARDARLAKFTRPDGAILLNGFGEALNHTLCLFKHRECLRLDVSTFPFTVNAGYPKNIEEDWPGVDFDRLDAALTVAPNRIYLFRGTQYIRVDLPRGQEPVASPRQFIQKRWAGVGFERLDTAVYWGNSKVYFFSGDQYVRYDMALCKADPGYPRFIPSNYVEDWEPLD